MFARSPTATVKPLTASPGTTRLDAAQLDGSLMPDDSLLAYTGDSCTALQSCADSHQATLPHAAKWYRLTHAPSDTASCRDLQGC